MFLRPSDARYAEYLPAANKRSQLSPALRAICRTEHAVTVMVALGPDQWTGLCSQNWGPILRRFLAISANVVIDLRGLNDHLH